jgi:hypothetical protein
MLAAESDFPISSRRAAANEWSIPEEAGQYAVPSESPPTTRTT